MSTLPCRLQQTLSKNLDFLNGGTGAGARYSGTAAQKKCGISAKTFNNMLVGRHISKIDGVEKVARLFGVEPWELLREDFIECRGGRDGWAELNQEIQASNREAVKAALLRLMRETNKQDVAGIISEYIAADDSQP